MSAVVLLSRQEIIIETMMAVNIMAMMARWAVMAMMTMMTMMMEIVDGDG